MNNQIPLILHKAKDSLDVARILSSQEYYDFAVSRAYYSMFYTAQALLLHHGLTYSSHSAVIAAYGREFSKTKILNPEFHTHLILVQNYRNQGDYGFEPEITPEQVQKAMEWAEEFLIAAELYISKSI